MRNNALFLLSLLTLLGSASSDQNCANTFLLSEDFPFTTPGGVTLTVSANGEIYNDAQTSCGVTSPSGAKDWLQTKRHWIKYDFSRPVSGPVTFMIVGMSRGEQFIFTTDQGPAIVTSISDPSCIEPNVNQIQTSRKNAGAMVTIAMPANTSWLRIAPTGSGGGGLFIMSGCLSTVGEQPTSAPTLEPTRSPTHVPTNSPTLAPTQPKCYYAECGCAPFGADWCSEDNFNAGWCSESASNCAQCSGVFSTECAGGSVALSPTYIPTQEPSFTPPEDIVALFEGQFHGESTYWYDDSGDGACGMQDIQLAQTLTQVGLSTATFFNGQSCGMCFEITTMETTIIGVVTDHCAECQTGDINILDVEGRTGRNPTSWRPIACPNVAAESFRYNIDEDSNEWYLKVQVRHTLRPVQSLSLVGKDGSWVALRSAGSFDSNLDDVDDLIQRPFAFPLAIRVCDIYENCVEDVISEFATGVDMVGSQQFPVMRRLLSRSN